jgi:methyltransferase (TIGR00027 family)
MVEIARALEVTDPAPGGRSLIAAANALFRAKESVLPEERRLLFDPWARCFVEWDPRINLVRYLRFVLPPLGRAIDRLQAAHCVRHRTIDELLLRSIREGYDQIVLIGAGYDMRATRFQDAASRLQWIEVDHPATMQRKWSLLEGVEGVNHDVSTVPIDLMRGALAPALERSAFDRSRATCFVLEGVIHYLSRPRLDRLFASIASLAPKRRVLLSFIRTDMYRRADSLFIRLVQSLREVPQLHFTPSELQTILKDHGLDHFESWTNPEQIERFAPLGRDRTIGLSQDVAWSGTD